MSFTSLPLKSLVFFYFFHIHWVFGFAVSFAASKPVSIFMKSIDFPATTSASIAPTHGRTLRQEKRMLILLGPMSAPLPHCANVSTPRTSSSNTQPTTGHEMCGGAVVVQFRWAPPPSSTPCEHGGTLNNRLPCILPVVQLHSHDLLCALPAHFVSQ